MRKLAFAVLIAVLLLTSSLAMAGDEPGFGAVEPMAIPAGGPHDFPTQVVRGFECLFGPYGAPSTDSVAVFAEPGMQTLVCAGEAYPDWVPDKGVTVDEGFTCGLIFYGIWTENSKITITPAGRMVMTCHANKSLHE